MADTRLRAVLFHGLGDHSRLSVLRELELGEQRVSDLVADGLTQSNVSRHLAWQAKADASEAEHGRAEQRALYVVSATFFAPAAYITFEAVQGLASRDEPESSRVGLILAVVSLAVMPTLAYAKQQTGRALGSRALQADAVETWVSAYLSLALLVGIGLNIAPAGGGPTQSPRSQRSPVIAWQGWETLEEAREKQSEDQ